MQHSRDNVVYDSADVDLCNKKVHFDFEWQGFGNKVVTTKTVGGVNPCKFTVS